MSIRVLVVHNAYQHRGGEDSVVEAAIALLESHGHQVATYFCYNDDIAGLSSLAVAEQTLWSSRTTHDVAALIDRFTQKSVTWGTRTPYFMRVSQAITSSKLLTSE